MARIHRFIIQKTAFEYEVAINGLNVTIEPTVQSNSEIHLTLATTLKILSEVHLRNSILDKHAHLALIEYFQEKEWIVHPVV